MDAMSKLLTIPTAVVLAGVWILLFGLGETSEVLDYAFGGAVTAIGLFNSQ